MRIPFFTSNNPTSKNQQKEINQDAQKDTSTAASKCENPNDDLRTPTTSAPRLPDIDSTINLSYHYDDDDIICLLRHALSDAMTAGKIQLGIPAEDPNRLFNNVLEWQSAQKTSSNDTASTLLILPYSDNPLDGEPSNHWSALFICQTTGQQNKADVFQAAYIDPLGAQTPIPNLFLDLLKQALPEHTIEEQLITHTPQRDGASCGPRVVEDAIEISQHFCKHGHLPDTLKNAEQRSAKDLRAAHIDLLDGEHGQFATKQKNWAPAAIRHTVASSEMWDFLQDELLAVFFQLSDEQHQTLCAAPTLETLEKMGMTFPKEFEPWRELSSQFIPKYEKTRLAQNTMIGALNTCAAKHPDLYDRLAKTWHKSPEGFAVVKTIREAMAEQINASDPSAWHAPQTEALTTLGKAFFKDMNFSSQTTLQALNDANFVDMELAEWAFNYHLDVDDSVSAVSESTMSESHHSHNSNSSMDDSIAALYT